MESLCTLSSAATVINLSIDQGCHHITIWRLLRLLNRYLMTEHLVGIFLQQMLNAASGPNTCLQMCVRSKRKGSAGETEHPPDLQGIGGQMLRFCRGMRQMWSKCWSYTPSPVTHRGVEITYFHRFPQSANVSILVLHDSRRKFFSNSIFFQYTEVYCVSRSWGRTGLLKCLSWASSLAWVK
jgi:hypothetical protein